MIESLGDFMSLAVTVLILAALVYQLYIVSLRNREEKEKKREARYYQYYDDADDDSSDDISGPYYGE